MVFILHRTVIGQKYPSKTPVKNDDNDFINKTYKQTLQLKLKKIN